MQLELTENDPEELDVKTVQTLYDKFFIAAKTLMQSKNHDYGEAWRNMTQESFVDLILMKLQRMRQIIANKGKTIASEGIDANFYDMINYAVFALILSMHQITFMKYPIRIVQVIVGLLFIVSGLVKANDPLGLAYKMQEFFELWNTGLKEGHFFARDFLVGFFNFLHDHALALSIFMITPGNCNRCCPADRVDEKIHSLPAFIPDCILYFFNRICISLRKIYQLRLFWRLPSHHTRDSIPERPDIAGDYVFLLVGQKIYPAVFSLARFRTARGCFTGN